jgi:hypothetical protein
MSVGLISPKRDMTAKGKALAPFILFQLEENITCQRTWTTHKFSVLWTEFDDLYASSLEPRRLQIVPNFLNIYMADNVQNNSCREKRKQIHDQIPVLRKCNHFQYNALKSKPDQSHVTAGCQSVSWYRVSLRAYDQISI